MTKYLRCLERDRRRRNEPVNEYNPDFEMSTKTMEFSRNQSMEPKFCGSVLETLLESLCLYYSPFPCVASGQKRQTSSLMLQAIQ